MINYVSVNNMNTLILYKYIHLKFENKVLILLNIEIKCNYKVIFR